METRLPTFAPVVKDIDNKSMTVRIHMDKRATAQIMERTSEYKALPNTLRSAIEEIGSYVTHTMIPRTFRKEGPGWKQLSRRSIREREAQGYPGRHPILRRTGDLYKELTEKSHPKHIEIIKVGKNARIQIGGSSAKFVENQMGKPSQRLPARSMIPGTGDIRIEDRDRQEMVKIIKRAYQQSINRPK